MSTTVEQATAPPQHLSAAIEAAAVDTQREIGVRIRALLASSGRSFSEVSRQAGIAAADLSSITRGNTSVTGVQLSELLRVLSIDRATLILGLSPEAVEILNRIFPEAAAGVAAEEKQTGLTAAPTAPGVQRKTDRARARRGNPPAPSSDPAAHAPRWGEPTFPGELTFLSFKQCLGRDFKRTESSKQEISFGYSSPCQVEVRVWTTLDSSTGRARPLGSDAIRVVLFDRRAGRKIEAWSCVLKRVGDCLDRLEAVVGHAVLRAKKRPTCSKCGEPLHICGKPDDQFWGCPNYYSSKRCTGARNLSLSGQQPSTPRRPAPPAASLPS